MTSDAQPAERSAEPSPALSTPSAPARARVLGRTGAAALAIGLAVLLAIVGGSVWLAAVTDRLPASWRASRLRLLATDLAASLVDAETGQRGFLLTGQPAFLAPFADAAHRLPGVVAALRQATQQQARRKPT